MLRDSSQQGIPWPQSWNGATLRALPRTHARAQVYLPAEGLQSVSNRGLLRPLPGVLVVPMAEAQSTVRLNRDGRAAFPGSGDKGRQGGDTGRPPKQVFYCGAQMGQCRCGGCDGGCGPFNGCPCYACAELIGLRSKVDALGLEDTAAAEAEMYKDLDVISEDLSNDQ